jgi:predicted transglutaminase-like cysteine proteinase
MSTISRTRIVAVTTLGLAILASSISMCEAASKAKARAHFFDDLITPSMLAPPSPPAQSRPAIARFFSINSVLAKLDGKPALERPVRLASVTNDDVVSDAPTPVTIDRSSPTSGEPFGLFTFSAPEGVLWRKWRAVKNDIDSEMLEVAKCRTDRSSCSQAANRFLLMIGEIRDRSGLVQIEIANRAVNGAIHYVSDLAQHGAIDVWSAPLASLSTGRGDCEDYAIAKYVLLREAGVSENDLRILLVRDKSVNEDHAVLAVRNAGSWVMLDNRRSALATDGDLSYFIPLYALHDGEVNLFASPYLTQRLNAEAKTVAPAAQASAGNDNTQLQEINFTSEFDSSPTTIGVGSGAGNLPILM